MDTSTELELRWRISKLERLAIINLETVMRLWSGLAAIPNLPEAVREDAERASQSIDEQIKALQELLNLAKNDESR
ncbi:hypothetical protein [Pseudomonas auratipiscis]|uniref:Uncharacterized protein n=1 Tax=Pseudomonas auratipiscis TaxID=3115853 RepID=A0AB35WTA0_9PSED|nr:MULTISPECIES: hypothetical protein [unclassified Pseudomonas]MEE1866908.1 hypothetical protein [Pseudomonas sp. 120P]MEE1960606.1 hypothetical protein [Pseudomonas sp. 119P]